MDVWPALSDSLEKEMVTQESDRRHIPHARETLERALITQFQAIADGLLADLILRRESVDTFFWAAQYLTRHSPNEADHWGFRETDPNMTAERKVAVGLAANHPQAIDEYKKSFYLRVARREIRRVHPNDLATLTVRIYGGRVQVWQEGRINTQLARLGSDLRLYVAQADMLRTADLLTKLGSPPKEPPKISVFLLGVVRPCTSYFKAQLLEFDHEYAVSPYIHSTSPGFTEQCRIVLRHRFWHGIVLNMSYAGHAWSHNALAMGFAKAILCHEIGHIHQNYGFAYGYTVPGHYSAWRPVIRSDICRFARVPRKPGEIYMAFHQTFDDLELSNQLSLWLLPWQEPNEDLKLMSIIQELLLDELLERTEDERLVCRLYDDGKEWIP